MNKKSIIVLVLSVCMLMSFFSTALAADEWTEMDFAFYNSDMTISEKPMAGDGYINIKEKDGGKTYRGIRVGSYPEELLQKYDLKDAEWSIYDKSKDASHGQTDRSKALTEKWMVEGKTGADVIAMSDFLCAKEYYYYIQLDIYKYNGQFLTKSQLPIDDIKAEIRESEIETALQRPENTYSRAEMEKMYDRWLEENGDSGIKKFIQENLRHHCRANYQFRIENGIITRIELSDFYYSKLGLAYNDDGTVNEYYAYILDLK